MKSHTEEVLGCIEEQHTSKTVTIPREAVEYLEELMEEYALDNLDTNMQPKNPEITKLTGEVYKILHWYASPSCRKNHPSWKPEFKA